MGSTLETQITGDRRLGARFDKLPVFRGHLIEVITELTDDLEAAIKADAPSRTGKLRRSIKAKVYNDKNKITGRVAVTEDQKKAGELEYGGAGRDFEVRSHQMRLDHVFATRLQGPTTVFVQAFDRTRQNAAKRFIRDPAATMHERATAAIAGAVGAAIAETDE